MHEPHGHSACRCNRHTHACHIDAEKAKKMASSVKRNQAHAMPARAGLHPSPTRYPATKRLDFSGAWQYSPFLLALCAWQSRDSCCAARTCNASHLALWLGQNGQFMYHPCLASGQGLNGKQGTDSRGEWGRRVAKYREGFDEVQTSCLSMVMLKRSIARKEGCPSTTMQDGEVMECFLVCHSTAKMY